MKFPHLLITVFLIILFVLGDNLVDVDPDVRRHKESRDALMQQDRIKRQDNSFRNRLSDTARKAVIIVDQIRNEAVEQLRVAGTIENPNQESFAGEMFFKAKDKIVTTKLWQIVREMPKGALLHAHLSAMLSYNTILDVILETDGMVVSASQSVNSEINKKRAIIKFAHFNHTISDPQISIDDLRYQADTPIPVKTAAMKFKEGRKGFEDFIRSKTTIMPEESVHHELGVHDIWRKFQSCFNPADTMLNYEHIVRTFYQKLMRQLEEDNVSWVEIRAGGSKGKLVPDGEEEPKPDLDFWWQVMDEEVKKFTNENFWGMRTIWSDYRGKDPNALKESMEIALERKQKFPKLFGGYDVVAQEDLGRTLLDMTPELIWLQKRAQNLDLIVPFFFHAGETLGDWNSTDLNLFDAVVFRTRRIGHGFSLYKHPTLLQEVAKENILVEVCPISNEVLRLSTDILHHPLPAMIAHGVPTAISNDDPAILGQDIAGVSYDFYQTILAFDSIGLAGLGSLARNSLLWSNFEDQSNEEWISDIIQSQEQKGESLKAQHVKQWDDRWETFCKWIVDNYSTYLPPGLRD